MAGDRGGRWAKIAAWIGRTTLPLWFGSILPFHVLHGLSFFIGPGVSAVGVAVTTISMLTMLFGWVLVVRYCPGGRSKLSRAFRIPSQARQ